MPVAGGGSLTYTHIREAAMGDEGVESEVVLRAADTEIPVMTFGTRPAVDNDAHLFDGRLALDEIFVDLVSSRHTGRSRR